MFVEEFIYTLQCNFEGILLTDFFTIKIYQAIIILKTDSKEKGESFKIVSVR